MLHFKWCILLLEFLSRNMIGTKIFNVARRSVFLSGVVCLCTSFFSINCYIICPQFYYNGHIAEIKEIPCAIFFNRPHRWLLVKSMHIILNYFKRRHSWIQFKCLICHRHLFMSCLIVSAFLNSFFLLFLHFNGMRQKQWNR